MGRLRVDVLVAFDRILLGVAGPVIEDGAPAG
jgi:hypothetical protein